MNDLQNWLDEAKSPCAAAKINVLVLLDLEVRSRWVANTFAECDIAYESFNPYANRSLFCLELSVSERFRSGRRLDFPIKLIKSMWPEVLRAPINPENRVIGRIQQIILHKIIHRTITPWVPVVEYLRYLKLRRAFDMETGR